MPGVLVESSTSSPHSFFPIESAPFSPSCFDANNADRFDSRDSLSDRRVPSPSAADLPPISPRSPISLSQFDGLGSSPPSPSSFRARELAQRFLPKSNLGQSFNSNVTDSSFDCSSELHGMPIPSPRKSLYNSNSSADSLAGSPLFSDNIGGGSPIFSDSFAALHKFLPSNSNDEVWPVDTFPAMDDYSCDDFRMYEFKVRRCMRGRSHDWTECPYAHPGEKARRRDPRRIHYSGTACPDFRKGSCKRGDACEYAHGVFECWLHPARYRTQPCKDGRACRRRVCFFAHTVGQLRVLPAAMTGTASLSPVVGSSPRSALPSYDGSPLRQALAGSLTEISNEANLSKEEKSLFAPCLLKKSMEDNGFGSGGYGASPSLSSPLHGARGSSPPGFSPPLSPLSPAMSPEICWSRNVSSVQTHVQSPLANSSPVSVPGHRRHLNRLQTMPTISIPSDVPDSSLDAASNEEMPMPFSLPASAHIASSCSSGANDLLHSLQTLQLRSRVVELQKSASTPSSPSNMKYNLSQHSPLRQCLYRSIPGTPISDPAWDLSTLDTGMEADPPFRVESGRDLRAKIYGKIGKENGVENGEDPDLGWVNELVK